MAIGGLAPVTPLLGEGLLGLPDFDSDFCIGIGVAVDRVVLHECPIQPRPVHRPFDRYDLRARNSAKQRLEPVGSSTMSDAAGLDRLGRLSSWAWPAGRAKACSTRHAHCRRDTIGPAWGLSCLAVNRPI